ncbi:MAG: TonB-dependent receptor [Verrucomicrobia bacterium]|nr:TonB-dependent receptor [Verrucomicrobiota bacterium]
MNHEKPPHRGECCCALALAALLLPLAVTAEVEHELSPLVVSALRIPQAASTVTSAVTVLDPADLESRGLLQLRDALNEAPGVIATSTSGQTGAVGSLFIRGTTTPYAQIVIDGMRLSDSNNPLGQILGGAHTYDVGSIEVLRGPQGAIYGGESIGGVLWLETPHGSGTPRGSTTVEAGSFASLAAYGTYQGQSGDLSYYLAGGYQETDNDAPNNHFDQGNAALRVEGKINPEWTLGLTFRGLDSFGQDPATAYSTHSESRVDSTLATLYAVGKISRCWTARFHAGYYQECYDQNYLDTWSGFPNSYFYDLRAGSISTDHEITLAENLRLLAGVFAHQDNYASTYSPDQTGQRYGAHSSLEWDVLEHLTATASLRWEDYDAWGDELTWRFGSIYTLAATGTTFRGSVGTSFRAPSYMQLFDKWGGNPELTAESGLGWDLGVKQQLGSHHTVETAWFRNQISDQINYNSSSAFVNIPGDSPTEGLELGLRGTWLDSVLNYRLAWTYLTESLSDQPRNAVTASLDWKPTAKALLGIGATHLSERSWGGTQLAGYTVARLYGSYQVSDRLTLHARLENALDEKYELASFGGSTVQGAGAGAYAGLTFAW